MGPGERLGPFSLALVGGEIYHEGTFKRADVYVMAGYIAQIVFNPDLNPNHDINTNLQCDALEIVDCKGLQVLPGLIDPHVHLALNLGADTSCDDFSRGTREAAKGGITTIIDFLDPIEGEGDLEDAYARRLGLAQGQGPYCDFGFHGTLGDFKGDVRALVQIANRLNLKGIKVFTTYSESNRMIAPGVLDQLLQTKELILVHAEEDALVDCTCSDVRSYADSRPLESELRALEDLVNRLNQSEGGRLYVVHVSSGSGVALLAQARTQIKGSDKELFIETCPHYIHFDQGVYQEPGGALYMMAPPLRSSEEVQRLISNFHHVNTVGTDHCPFTLAQKTRGGTGPKGVGGLAHSFLMMYRVFGNLAIDPMSKHVAEIFGLKQKGRIAIGLDADFCLFDPRGETLLGAQDPENPENPIFEEASCQHSIYTTPHKSLSPKALGKIVGTILRGEWVMKGDQWFSPRGREV